MILADVIYHLTFTDIEEAVDLLNPWGILIEVHPEDTTQPGLLMQNMTHRTGLVRWENQPEQTNTLDSLPEFDPQTERDSPDLDTLIHDLVTNTLTSYQTQIEAVCSAFEHGVSQYSSTPFIEIVDECRAPYQ